MSLNATFASTYRPTNAAVNATGTALTLGGDWAVDLG